MRDFPWMAVIAGVLANILVTLLLYLLGLPAYIDNLAGTIAMGVVAIPIAYWRYR